MTADTHSFLALQEIYQTKAREDIDAIAANVSKILKSVGKPEDAISHDDVRLFCRNAQFLRFVRTRSLTEEYTTETAAKDNISSSLYDNGIFYVLLRAVDRFYSKQGRFPGWKDDQVQTDLPLLKELVQGFLTENGCEASAVSDDVIHEMCRFGASELHNIAAFLGGVVSQEAIKILTHQWVPLNNTLIFNGMKCTSETFQF